MPTLFQTLRQLRWNRQPLTPARLEVVLGFFPVEYVEMEMDMRFSGFYGLCEGVEVIVVNSLLPPEKKHEVGTHEFCHLLSNAPHGYFYSDIAARGTLDQVEYRAHRLAACFLIPKKWCYTRTYAEIREDGLSDEIIRFRLDYYRKARM